MMIYLNTSQLINPSQHGFVLAKSCTMNILETLDIITNGLADHYEVIMILLDFDKAFDKVSHQLFLVKLKALEFDSKTINWIKAFLANRQQRVVLGQTISGWKDVLSSVPLSAVLGPLLFIIFINGMPDLVKNFCKLFADDTKLIGIITSMNDRDELQMNLDRLVEWSHIWLMSFNKEKCKTMYFEARKRDTGQRILGRHVSDGR